MDGKEIGARISKLRKDFKMTKRFMAKALGISYSSACAYEYGTRIPGDDVKIKIANLFGVSVEYLFYSVENNNT